MHSYNANLHQFLRQLGITHHSDESVIITHKNIPVCKLIFKDEITTPRPIVYFVLMGRNPETGMYEEISEKNKLLKFRRADELLTHPRRTNLADKVRAKMATEEEQALLREEQLRRQEDWVFLAVLFNLLFYFLR